MSMVHIRYEKALVVLGMLCAGSLALPAQGASFDCAKASTKVEHMICDNPELSKLDDELAAKFKSAQPGGADRAELVRDQRQWLSERNACPSVACVKDAYEKRLTALTGEQKSHELPESASEKDKVRQIMMSHHFSLNLALPKSSEAFCRAFLDDFRAMRGITFLTPVTESDNYDDKKWDAYKARCPDTGLFEGFACDPQTQEDVDSLPEGKQHAEKMRSCKLFRCTQKFKMFKVAAKGYNGPALDAFYCEHMRGPMNLGYTDEEEGGGYQFVNPQHCSLSSWVLTTDPYNYGLHYPLENHNGIIIYGGRYFVFDLFEPDVAKRIPMRDYILNLSGGGGAASQMPARYVPPTNPICMFSTIHDSTGK
jgi:uncharacterized protein